MRSTSAPGCEPLTPAAALRLLVCLAGLGAITAARAQTSFVDPADGWLDASNFIDTAYGFAPVVAPITEPAIGYGLAVAAVFIDRPTVSAPQEFVRPNIAVIGGLGTENDTRGGFAAHLGTWRDGRLRSLAAVADLDVNLEFFGLGGERSPQDAGLAYTVSARGGVLGGNARLGDTPWWLGLRYLQADTRVNFDLPDSLPGIIDAEDLDLRLGALTPSLTLDRRDNFFTPTRGWYVDLSAPLYRDALGSERDFETMSLLGMYYRPLSDALFLAVRGGLKASSDGTPFYLRPFVWLRGVRALGYQGEQVAELEMELRWQLHPRFSLVGFGGAGLAHSDIGTGEREETVTAGGAGFRYLVARRYGLHMGIDLAVGPDETAIYVIFGSAWVRP